MARIAVLCGTGMSAFASQLASVSGAAASTMRVDSERGSVGARQARPVPARPILLGVQRGFYPARTSLQKPAGSQ